MPAPRVEIRFTAQGLTGRAFSPLQIPGSFDVNLVHVDLDLVQEADLSVSLELTTGRVELPITDSLTLPVEIEPGTRARGQVRAGKSARGAVVREAELFFERPLRLGNIIPVLTRLNTLFEDRRLAAWMRRYQLTGPVGPKPPLASRLRDRFRPQLDRLFPPGTRERRFLHEARRAMQGGGEVLADVLLDRIHAHLVDRDGTPVLELRFSGEFVVFGRAPVPFYRVRLPDWLLPSPHAGLVQLVSGDPFVTAALHQERVPREALAGATARILSAFSVEMSVEATVPPVNLGTTLPGSGTLGVDLTLPGPLKLQGTFNGEVDPDGIRMRSERFLAHLGAGAMVLSGEAVLHTANPAQSTAATVALAALNGTWPADELLLDLDLRVEGSSNLPRLDMRVRYQHPVLHGENNVGLALTDVAFGGRIAMEGIRPELGSGRATGVDLRFSSGLSLATGSRFWDPLFDLTVESHVGSARGHLTADRDGLTASLSADGESRLRALLRTAPFPELGLMERESRGEVHLHTALEGSLRATELESGLVSLDFSGTDGTLTVHRAVATHGALSLTLPPESRFHLALPSASLDTSAWGEANARLDWDLQGQSPLLMGSGQQVELFVPALRRGKLSLHLNQVGGLVIKTEEDEGVLYDARYFNALLNPDQELDRWMALMEDEETVRHILDAARVLSPELADKLERLRAFMDRVRRAAEAEGVEVVADLLPAPVIARVLSRVLVDSAELEPRILPLVEAVVAGVGLDVRGTKKLLEDVLPEHDWAFELDRGLRWVAQTLSPTQPIPPRPVRELPSLSETPGYVHLLRALPDARSLYQTVRDPAPLTLAFSRAVARVAPYLTRAQVDWLLAQGREDWHPGTLTRLRYVAALKRRVAALSEFYGGFAFALQPLAISLWVEPTVAWRPDSPLQPIPGEPQGMMAHPDALLGPQDAAVLLQAGLTAPVQGRIVQHNQRLLLDLILKQPAEFLRQVLFELGLGNAQILTSALMALLNMSQSAIKQPLDLVGIFSEKLKIDLPRLEDYLAGGRYARLSYYEALAHRAETILSEAEPYQAMVAKLQRARRSLAPGPQETPRVQELAEAAREAIAAADEAGRACAFKGREPRRRADAAEAYQGAFAAVRALIEADPAAFHRPWVKAFILRRYEALMVRSVVTNLQEGVDLTRAWFQTRLGRAIPRPEQALVEAVVEVLYADASDRSALLDDPLVRLLVPPREGRYDLTIVSAMGVVTEGAQGTELAAAFKRLEARYGVKVVRADTSTARSLQHNSSKIIDAIKQIEGPWAWLGYSQGVANAMWAETRLHSGSPDQQAIADRMVGRHLLFSALNGSGHGTGGEWKFRQAMIAGDHFVAHYQTVLSHHAITLGLALVQQALDSRLFVHSMGGVDSLSYEGAERMGREMQVRGHAPTTLIRGIISEPDQPEALVFLSNTLSAQIETTRHDSQVQVDEAVGYPVTVLNPAANQMRAAHLSARPQATHHWSPLSDTVEFLTTDRDRERYVYEVPKDRQVFPWVEMMGEFGFVTVEEHNG
ncbi:MAG: hypothetical protein JXX28_19910 [Deltaproteobacteria bacterium]|nr:hypothetical protein [Deltaproteobacteria bacterium]